MSCDFPMNCLKDMLKQSTTFKIISQTTFKKNASFHDFHTLWRSYKPCFAHHLPAQPKAAPRMRRSPREASISPRSGRPLREISPTQTLKRLSRVAPTRLFVGDLMSLYGSVLIAEKNENSLLAKNTQHCMWEKTTEFLDNTWYLIPLMNIRIIH